MRSQRHKYVRHCAIDCLHSHDRCGWRTHTTPPMKGALIAQEIYKWRIFDNKYEFYR